MMVALVARAYQFFSFGAPRVVLGIVLLEGTSDRPASRLLGSRQLCIGLPVVASQTLLLVVVRPTIEKFWSVGGPSRMLGSSERVRIRHSSNLYCEMPDELGKGLLTPLAQAEERSGRGPRVSSSGAGGQGVSPWGWLTNRVTVMLKVPTLPRSGGVAVHKVGLRYGLILLGKGQFGLHLLGSRPGSELRGDHWGHKLRDVWDDVSHHSGKCLDLVGEAKETSTITTGGPIFIVGGENHGSLNSFP
ncbi:hypothetical protein B296_00002832 [Ensete ventricosum]|uniref:Uncharacterized protein n=1 Tax=Ensete ventricosum TaxID=4639 RepID=A0A427A4H7_ENSVE|nr:hypothetical protein B296_00002832 [Ensete ventricosum]